MMSMLTPPRPAGWSPPDPKDRDAGPAGLQVSVPGGPGPGVEQPRRAPIWPWVLLAAGVALAGLMVLLLVAGIILGLSVAGDDAAPPEASEYQVVLSEDFSQIPGSFEEYAEQGFTAQVVDGAYVITSDDVQFTDWVTTAVPRSDVIDVSARIALAEGAEEAAEVGLTVEGPQGGYAFTVSTGSGSQISLITPGQEMEVVYFGDAVDEASGEVRLTVVPTEEGSTLVRGFLDGRQVVTYEEAAQVAGFTEVGLAVYADAQPVTARFDDVVVRTAP